MLVQTFKTGEDKPILRTLMFNLDSIKEIEEFKELIIEAHRQVISKPTQIETVSIIQNKS